MRSWNGPLASAPLEARDRRLGASIVPRHCSAPQRQAYWAPSVWGCAARRWSGHSRRTALRRPLDVAQGEDVDLLADDLGLAVGVAGVVDQRAELPQKLASMTQWSSMPK